MNIIKKVNDAILTPLIVLLFALAVAYFLFGLMKFIMNQDSEEDQAAGKQHMLWGVVGLAIMASVWGILNLISESVKGLTS
ncbi:MAG: hypothetical protein AAB497_03850 [Patescibacteria group bacterium]